MNQFGPPAHDDEQQQEAAALLLQQVTAVYVATHKAAAAAAAVHCMHTKLTSPLIRRLLNHHRAYFGVYVCTDNKIHDADKKN